MARRRGYLWLNWVNVRRRIEKGQRCGGRKIGSRNKATIERERTAILALERAKALEEAKAAGVVQELEEAKASGRKLMKEIGFDFAHVFAGLAEFYRPFPQWTVIRRAVNTNPNYNEAKFKEYAVPATQMARDFAGYESPKLSAVMVGSALVTEIVVTGGLPDEEDGGLIEQSAAS
jgi:hypothetical protein